MNKISDTGREMLAYQEALAREYKYQPIGINLFTGDIRAKYRAALPDWCRVDGDPDIQLETTQGTILCNGYTRIVIGDYGAFVEISQSQIRNKVLRVQPGQEYRQNDDQFSSRVKYLWLTTTDCSGCKIYDQQRTVDYADYIPGMYYVSPYELFPSKHNNQQ